VPFQFDVTYPKLFKCCAVYYVRTVKKGSCFTANHILNLTSCVPIFHQWFTKHGSKELDTPKRLASGALAGITSVCTYSRRAVYKASICHAIFAHHVVIVLRFNLPLGPRSFATFNRYSLYIPYGWSCRTQGRPSLDSIIHTRPT
jgi:hypothetical protein